MLLPAGQALLPGALLDLMMRAGVVAGVVEAALHEAEAPAAADRRIVVARGTAPVPARDARVEVLVDFALRLAEDAGHRVDFHEQGRFHEIDAGAVLARLVPKRPGTPGRTVLGRELPVGEPRDADLSAYAGEGTLLQAEVGDGQVVAERTGLVVRRPDGHLDIMPKVELRGDLDMRCGNLVTRLPVEVAGDIIAGFSLKSEASATVKGAIEDARVSVKGDLVCGGILPGKHRVKAHGDLRTRHISGRVVKCRGLQVANDVRGATVFAIGDVAAKVIISSTIHCGGSLVCDELGHPDEHSGLVQVGLDPLAVALWRLAARERETLAAETARHRQECKRLAVWVKDETDPVQRAALAGRLQQALAAYEASVARQGECEAVLANDLLRDGNNHGATVTVNQVVHPGIEVMIGADARCKVTKALGRTVFRLHDGKVVWE